MSVLSNEEYSPMLPVISPSSKRQHETNASSLADKVNKSSVLAIKAMKQMYSPRAIINNAEIERQYYP